jgi:6-phosphogluconolactonase (cycloisomerase 2 family)
MILKYKENTMQYKFSRITKIVFISSVLLFNNIISDSAYSKSKEKENNITIVAGTYTNGASEGIYTFRMDLDNLNTELLSKIKIDNPSYLCVSPDKKFIYSVSEAGKDNSFANAFNFNVQDGSLNFINKKKVDDGPCYIIYDKANNFVGTANYMGGSVSFVKVSTDGSLLDSDTTIFYKGRSVDTVRQAKPHIHCLTFSPDGKSIFATDLGTDNIHKIDIDKKSFSFCNSGKTTLTPRSGARHLIFNKKGTLGYLINEISGMVSVFKIDKNNNLKLKQEILADTCHAEGSADIHLSKDEKFLYASTRLEGDGIAIFEVKKGGLLERKGYKKTEKHPRNFAVTPDGRLMLVACRDGNKIQIFRINNLTGMLEDTGKEITLDKPVCIKFVE